jgi:hypothetical protein
MKKSLVLAALFLLQVLAPTIASAQTNPPTNSGDWTIPVNDVTYLNNSQALVQGDVNVYGTLILQDSSVFLWGANNGDREFTIYSGGTLIVNNSIISAYSSACIDFRANTGTVISFEGSRLDTMCRVLLNSKTMYFNDTTFEKSFVELDLDESTSIFDSSTGQTTYHANLSFQNLIFSNRTSDSSYYTTMLLINAPHQYITSELLFNNITFVINKWNLRGIQIQDQPTFNNLRFENLTMHSTYAFSTDTQAFLKADHSFIQIRRMWGSTSITFNNFSLQGGPHHRAIYQKDGYSGQLNLMNGMISNFGIVNYSQSSQNAPFDLGGATNALVVELKDVHLLMDNVTIKDNIRSHYSHSNTDYLDGSKHCTALYMNSMESMDISNSTIENNCNYQYYNTYNRITNNAGYSCSNTGTPNADDYTERIRAYDAECNQWTFSAIRHETSSLSTMSITDSIIRDNNLLIHQYNHSSSANYGYRHAILTSVGIISDGQIEISNSIIENNTNAQLVRAFLGYNNQDLAAIVNNHELVLSPSSTTYSYINNTRIHLPTCYTQSVGSYQHAGSYCKALSFDDSTINLVNSTVNQSDLEVLGGEAIVYFHLDVRVTDPDGQWTPNASVQVTENGFWNLGTQSTGSSGGLTRFTAKHFSQSTTQYYTYTPHQITVTMTNYSNSTSVNVTQYTSVIVFDPTPDAFPGDITQDWDNDSDGYGDNISGNNPDHFPNDSTQWNDTDGDGWGDNQNGNNPDRLPNDNTQWNDTDGDGYGDNQSGNNPDRLPNDNTQWNDADGDGYGDNQNGNNPDAFINDNTQWSDVDFDGYGDNQSGNNPDRFPNDITQWNDTDADGYGDNANGNNGDAFPLDSTQHYDGDGDGLGDNQSGNNPDPYLNDSDNDGYNNSVDTFPWNPTQHEDLDGDGLGDNTSGTAADPYPNDTDNDGTNNTVDPFPLDPTQWEDNDQDGYGDNQSGNNPDPSLDDSDNDGVNNTNDAFPNNPTQTTDSDGDGWGDNPNGYPADAFPNEASQWLDSDGDGHGDNANGVSGDAFPNNPTQWQDSDGDGYGDDQSGFPADAYPNDASQWFDSDGDGYGDNASGTNPDAFPNDPTQWADQDGDGYGDNASGTLADAYPSDPSQWADSDGDGYGDNYAFSIDPQTGLRTQSGDAFPLDGTQWSDLDGDGHGENINGTQPDEFPYDATQWRDRDLDGFPDNYFYDLNSTTGLRENQIGDAFPDDSTQWSDIDGDGFGDNPNGNNPDVFPTDPTQWADADEDGLGDNPNGTNPDPTPGDTDNDGVPDYQDAFPYEPTQWADSDGDGYGDNWGATSWTTLRPSSWPGRFVQNAVLVDFFPTISAAVNDSDFDGFPDQWSSQDTGNNRAGLLLDACPLIFGNATTAGPGCPDGDGDNVADQDDAFPIDPTQWSDVDGDGYGDNQDGSFPDRFPNDPSQCCDVDGDGWGDNASADPYDAFPNDPTQWSDADGDGFGDNPTGSNPDAFPNDSTQWLDQDNDGLGDNPEGNNPDQLLGDGDNDGYPDDQDDCPSEFGNSTYDRSGCIDSDGDGVSDSADLWPNDPSRSLDSDGDGVNDPDDAFPNEPTQWIDNDIDGLGDNPNGVNPDPYLDDSDNDGVINQNDAFPNEPTQWADIDGDGLGDNPEGANPDPSPNDTDNDGVQNPEDLYPLNPDQSSDSDGDGWGDNPNGLDGDQYPNDPTQCCDTDGDGWGDNPNGTMPDAFVLDPTQWLDADRDGFGDNPDGSNPDPSPNDTDNDGVPNNQDGWPQDPTKSLDSDGDGIEDGDENFLMTNIPATSASAVLTLALFVGALTGAAGFFMGQRGNRPNAESSDSTRRFPSSENIMDENDL